MGERTNPFQTVKVCMYITLVLQAKYSSSSVHGFWFRNFFVEDRLCGPLQPISPNRKIYVNIQNYIILGDTPELSFIVKSGEITRQNKNLHEYFWPNGILFSEE